MQCWEETVMGLKVLSKVRFVGPFYQLTKKVEKNLNM